MYKRAKLAGMACLSITLLGCSGKNSEDGVYDIKGVVVAVDTTNKTVELDHEAVGKIMDAMDMSYSVATPAILQSLKPGDSVQGKLEAKSGNYTITSLGKR